jgi:DnaJ-class molecular chaperone
MNSTTLPPKIEAKPQMTRCAYCDGSGEAYNGCPSDPNSYAGDCDHCKGKGKVAR